MPLSRQFFYAALLVFSSAALIFNSLSAQGEVYRWEKPDGTVVYSDEPGPNAKKVEVKELPTVNLPAPPLPEYKSKPTDRSPGRYKTLEISSPANDTTIRDNTGTIAVSVTLTPSLKPVHRLQLKLNGTVVSPPAAATQFQVSGVNRGSHTLVAEVVSEDGKAVQSSAPVTVHLFKFSKLH